MKVIGTALYHPYEDSPIKESRINSSTRVEFKTNFSIKRGKLCVSGTEPIVLQGFFIYITIVLKSTNCTKNC